MKDLGAVLWVLGLLLFGWALLFFDPTIVSPAGTATDGAPDRIVNLALQQQRLLLALAGLEGFVAGVFVHALGHAAEIFRSAAR